MDNVFEESEEKLTILKSLEQTFIDTEGMLEALAFNAETQPQSLLTPSNHFFLFGACLDSAIKTLKSIRLCTLHYGIADAFTLVRRYRDTLFQYLFILYTLDYNSRLPEVETIIPPTDIFNENELIDFVEKVTQSILQHYHYDKLLQAASSWFDNTLPNDANKSTRKDYFDYSKYLTILKSDSDIRHCLSVYFDELDNQTSRILNNYSHINGAYYVYINRPNIYEKESSSIQREMELCIENNSLAFLSILILIRPTLITSTDYVDALELNQTPIEGSQYWVIPLINNYLGKYRKQTIVSLKDYLRNTNKYGMQIE